jgi:hypothetical protein
VQQNFELGVALGVVIGWVTLWSFLKPAVGRIIVRMLGVAGVGLGVWWAVAAIADRASGQRDMHYETPWGRGGFGMALGWGLGFLVLGILTLVLSFLRRRRPVQVPEQGKPARPVEERVLG